MADTAPGSVPAAQDRHRPARLRLQRRRHVLEALHPPRPLIPLTRSQRDGDQIVVEPIREEAPKLAFVGVRACELAALNIQERAMRAGPAGDPDHAARRDAALVVAVECAAATSTCFCTSMGSGPEVDGGADVVLSELDEGFVVRVEATPVPLSSSRSACGRRPRRGRPSRVPGRRRPRRRLATPVPTTGCPSGSARRSTIRAGPRSPSAASPAPTARSSARPASARASGSPPISTASRRRPSATGTAASASASGGSPATPTSGRRSATATASG